MAETKNNLEVFFNPKSVAIVGATEKVGSLPGVILKNLLDMGFKGRILPVNPKYKTVFDLPCYESVLEIPQKVELVVIAVPAKFVPQILEQQGKMGIKDAVIVSAGFREIGGEGIELEETIKRISKKKGIRVLGPNCLGVLDNYSNFTTSFLPWERVRRPKAGGLTILSQSGAFAIAVLDLAAQEGMGIARVANYGNRMDIGESDFLNHLAEDPYTKVIALYMESVDNGRKFVEAAARCSKAKPLIALKVGKGEAGAIAAHSHTGAIAGRYEIYKAAFMKAGIIEAVTLEAFIDGAKILSMLKPPKGNRILIITNGGGFGVIVADSCNERGFRVPAPSQGLKERLMSKFSRFYVVNNPIDLTGSATDENYMTAINTCLVESDEYDAAIVIPLMAPQCMTERVVDLVTDGARFSGKPVAICTVGGEYTMRIKRMFEERGLPVFPSPERAVRAMGILIDRGKLQEALES
ncbi:MAG TPA: acetate--CoA ligase family protein [Candidatus Brocadiia bacterium]|nr:CoA-binding protein [Candidatus Brocadiales bacterium]